MSDLPKTNLKLIKVMFVLPSLIPGGIEKHLIKQLPLFDKSKFKISVTVLFDYKNRPNLFDDVPKDVELSVIDSKGMFDLGGTGRFIKVIKGNNPDIVVSSMFSANSLVRVLKPFFKYKVITREHNTYEEKTFVQKFIDKVLSLWTYKIVAVSKWVADFASKQASIPLSKFVVIHNGVDASHAEQMVKSFSTEQRVSWRKENNIPLDAKLVLSGGRLKKTKNQKLLINAVAKILPNYPNLRFYFLGEGDMRAELEQQIKDLDLTSKVFLLGYKDNSEKEKYFAESTCFALTSFREGFSNMIVESLAEGTPVISTLVAGVDEVIENGQNGFIVESTVGSVSEALEKILNLNIEEKKRFSQNAFKTAERFSIENNVKKYEELFVGCFNSN